MLQFVERHYVFSQAEIPQTGEYFKVTYSAGMNHKALYYVVGSSVALECQSIPN